ncbi:MAG: serine/threonine protein kinase [Polyangiaceae bacterium]|nr:serine/threonine protein kinase [Polyangiaceae bacterium]
MSQPSLVGRSGLVIGGRYLLEAFLGKGAMGEVWRARHTSLGTPYALKLVSVTSDPETVSRLLLEARSAASIVSPNVVRIYDHGQDGGIAYIAMELLLGETLAARLKRIRKLSPHATALVTRDIAQGILVAHRSGIIHRDLKPENVFITRSEHGEVSKVLDFGIAKSLSMPNMTSSNVVVGTPAYLSREQVMGTHAVDHQADLWALSILVYECLTGRLPYAAATMAELFVQIVGGSIRDQAARASDLPHGFGAWFLRATHPDPTQRFADARDLADTLARVLAPDLSIVPWEVGAPSRVPPPAKRSRGVYIAAGMGVLAVGLCFLVYREATRFQTSSAHAKEAERTEATASANAAPTAAATATATSAPTSTEPTASATASATSSAAGSAVSSVSSGNGSSSAASASASAPRKPPPRYNRWGL